MAETTHGLLARILEDSALLTRVRELDASTLGRVIRHVGLEDAGEIVALATAEQLRDMFDEDLWAAQEPGQAEAFDARRFALWLEVMLESGEQFVADKLTELPEELVTLGLQRQVLVIDIDALAVEMSDRHRDVDLVEKALESCLCEEIEQYRVIARRHDHWDAVLAVLLALDQNHHAYLRRLLERCCDATTEYIEDNGGLYEVLSSEEVIEVDAAAEREDRRAAAGFVAPTDAVSFLALPRVVTLEDTIATPERDPVTKAYFRSVAPSAQPTSRTKLDDAGQARFTGLLRDAGVTEPVRPALPCGKAKSAPSFQRSIAAMRKSDPELYAQRTEELAYLTNVLVTGSSFAGRTFRPVEAAEAAIATCNLGFEKLLAGSTARASQAVRRCSADHAFRIGWHLLFHDVSMHAAAALERSLVERNVAAKIVSSVRAAIADQKPWLIRPRLRAIGTSLADDERVLFHHLIDRCPTLPPAHAGQSARFLATLADLELARGLLES